MCWRSGIDTQICIMSLEIGIETEVVQQGPRSLILLHSMCSFKFVHLVLIPAEADPRHHI